MVWYGAVLVVLLVLLLVLLWRWQRRRESEAGFSGTLRDSSGAPLAGAIVRVGSSSTVTDGEGRFILKGSWTRRERWVLEVKLSGYAPISKVFAKGADDLKLTTVETTIQRFDPASTIVLRDTRTSCIGSITGGIDWDAHPLARFPQVIDTNGNRITGPPPPGARRVLDFASGSLPCSSGFQISIPATGLVTASGEAVRDQVEIEVSTIDLYSPDGMPGDDTVASDESAVYMESLGAGTAEARLGGEVLLLAKGTKAQVEIPVDRAQIDAGAKVPPKIPMLRYDGQSGTWLEIGSLMLDADRMVYVGEVTHLSAFNADVIKTDPACIRFDVSAMDGSFDLVTTAPTSSGGFRHRTHPVAPNPEQTNPNLHAVYNLPPEEWVLLRALRDGTPLGTWVVETAAPWSGAGAPPYDYAPCGSIFELSENVDTYENVVGYYRERFGKTAEWEDWMLANRNRYETAFERARSRPTTLQIAFRYDSAPIAYNPPWASEDEHMAALETYAELVYPGYDFQFIFNGDTETSYANVVAGIPPTNNSHASGKTVYLYYERIFNHEFGHLMGIYHHYDGDNYFEAKYLPPGESECLMARNSSQWCSACRTALLMPLDVDNSVEIAAAGAVISDRYPY